jgi:hypothetical protein
VLPKVSDVLSTWVVVSKMGLERIETRIFPLRQEDRISGSPTLRPEYPERSGEGANSNEPF